jgi:alkanesulfonate monooxygenase SsuD/methylene tetrahydromethanopterin reductase-like flavin-dependent oxidoreductase (luciferase family)
MEHRTRPTEIAIALPAAARGTTAAYARRAEERGFDRLVAAAGGPHDALVALAVAAGATVAIRLAAVGLALPGRSPAVLGREARTLDELSSGRLALGVSTESDGLPPRLTRGDGRAFDAALDALRTGVAAAVPLLVGGADRRAIERVARVADGWVAPTGATAQDVAIARGALGEGWRWNGRGGTPQILVELEAGDPGSLPARVAALADAGATAVVVVLGHDDLEAVDAVADALDLTGREAVAR